MSKQISAARLEANRRNAQKSTGPRTPQGKSRSSRNAITHGLLAENHSIPEPSATSDPATPDPASPAVKLFLRFITELHPVGIVETALVDRLAGLQQRRDRIRTIESGLFDNAMTSILEYHPEHAQPGQQTVEDCLAAPGSTLLAEAYIHQSRTLNLLSFYEARLSRDFHRTLAELRQTQALRRTAASGIPSTPDPARPKAQEHTGPLDGASQERAPLCAVQNEHTGPLDGASQEQAPLCADQKTKQTNPSSPQPPPVQPDAALVSGSAAPQLAPHGGANSFGSAATLSRPPVCTPC